MKEKDEIIEKLKDQLIDSNNKLKTFENEISSIPNDKILNEKDLIIEDLKNQLSQLNNESHLLETEIKNIYLEKNEKNEII